MDKDGHEFDWDNTFTIAQAKQGHAREFLEAWRSNWNSINKHIELDTIYKPLKNRIESDVNHPSKLRHINNKWDRTPTLHWR
eukprot:g48199.t1